MRGPAVGMEGHEVCCGDRGRKRLSVVLERQGEEAKGWRYTGMGSEGWRPDMERFNDLDEGRWDEGR